MFTPLSFGDIFTLDDREYIYLDQGEAITYAALILDKGQSAGSSRPRPTKRGNTEW